MYIETPNSKRDISARPPLGPRLVVAQRIMGQHRASALFKKRLMKPKKVTAITEFTTNSMWDINTGDQSVFLSAGLCSKALVRCNPTSSKVISTSLLFGRFLSSIIFRQLRRNINSLPRLRSLFSWALLGFGLPFHSKGRIFINSSMTSSVTDAPKNL